MSANTPTTQQDEIDLVIRPYQRKTLQMWTLTTLVVIVFILVDGLVTNTLSPFLASSSIVFIPGMTALAIASRLSDTSTQKLSLVSFFFFAGIVVSAYLYALMRGPWRFENPYVIFSVLPHEAVVYFFAYVFLPRNAKRACFIFSCLICGLAALCIGSYIAFAPREVFINQPRDIQPYIYSLFVPWGLHISSGGLSDMYKTLMEAHRKVSQMKETIIAMVGHDVRTPLQVIINSVGNAQVLAARYSVPPGQGQSMAKTLDIIKRCAFDVQSVLESASVTVRDPNAPKPRPVLTDFDLRDLLEAVVEHFKSDACARSIDLRIVNGHSMPALVTSDRSHISRIVTNLVSNALKYADKGSIEVKAWSPGNNNLCVSVSDTGIGIPSASLDQIFEPHVRLPAALSRGAEGRGLGLAIVKLAVESLGGTVTVTSAVGQGSCFTVTIPGAVNSFYCRKPGQATVLIVDDEPVNLEVLVQSIELLSLPVPVCCLTAHNGEEALSVLSTQDVDMVFLDIQMPGIDGFEVARKLRSGADLRRNAETPIVGMSGSSQARDTSDMHAFLARPFLFDFDLFHRFLKFSIPSAVVSSACEVAAHR